jgi:hypothetical protein
MLFYRKAGNLLIWQIRSKQLNLGRNKWDTPQIICNGTRSHPRNLKLKRKRPFEEE